MTAIVAPVPTETPAANTAAEAAASAMEAAAAKSSVPLGRCGA